MTRFDIFWSTLFFVLGVALFGGAYLFSRTKDFGLCICFAAAAVGALVLALQPFILKYWEEIRWFISSMLIELGWE